MTLHVAFICNSYVLQIGDRLLTRSIGGKRSEWDTLANKTIFLETQNGRVALSYAGLARMAGMATDEWLVREITGLDRVPPLHSGGGPPMHFGPPMRLTIGSVVTSVVAAVNSQLPAERVRPADRSLELLISGWTWPRDVGRRDSARPSTYAVAIAHDGKRSSTCSVTPLRRRRYRRESTGWATCSIGAGRKGQFREINNRLRNRRTRADDVELELVRTIRNAAARPNSGIGKNLVSVYLPITANEDPRIRYWRDTELRDVNAYTPAFVSWAGAIIHPGTFTGAGQLGLTHHDTQGRERTIRIEAIPPMVGDVDTFRSQKRKPV